MSNDLKYTLFKEQAIAFRASMSNKVRHVACVTGYGGGKSLLLAIIGNVWCAENPGNFIMVAAPTFPQLEKTIWRSFLDVTPPGVIVKQNNSDLKLILDYSNGTKPPSEIFFASAEVDPIKWQGFNLGGALFDEAEGISDKHWKTAKSRLRRVDPATKHIYPNKIVIATNPPPADHWLAQDFLYKPKKGHKLFTWSMVNNPHTPEGFIEDQFQTFQGQDRERYVHGVIGSDFAGKIYDFNTDIHELHFEVCDMISRLSPLKVYGIDWGSEDPFVCLECSWWPDRAAWVITKEFYQNRLSHDEQTAAFGAMYDDRFVAYCDRDPQDSREFAVRGYQLTDAYKANNYKAASVKYINGLLHIRATGKYKGYPKLYVSTRCENAVLEFNSYKRKIDKDTGGAIDDTYEGPDHAMDALRYALYSHHYDNGNYEEDELNEPIQMPDRVTVSRSTLLYDLEDNSPVEEYYKGDNGLDFYGTPVRDYTDF